MYKRLHKVCKFIIKIWSFVIFLISVGLLIVLFFTSPYSVICIKTMDNAVLCFYLFIYDFWTVYVLSAFCVYRNATWINLTRLCYKLHCEKCLNVWLCQIIYMQWILVLWHIGLVICFNIYNFFYLMLCSFFIAFFLILREFLLVFLTSCIKLKYLHGLRMSQLIFCKYLEKIVKQGNILFYLNIV